MNRRSFIRSLAIGSAAVAIAPHLSFSGIDDSQYVIVQIFWPNMKNRELDRDLVSIDFCQTNAAEFLAFKPSVFRNVVEPMLKEDKVKYQADY